MPELVINVTNIISSLCYTVLKVEPYTICPFRCSYCYSKWYIRFPTEYPYPRFKAVGMFKDFVKKVFRTGLKPIPFRLSTLVDPFPPIEQLYRVTEKILRIALDFEYPMIINTKSTFYMHEPIKSIIWRLLDKGLIVLQISLSCLNPYIAEKLEPKAPLPNERLRVLQQLGSTDIPLVIRLSPYIPYVSPTNDNDVEEFSYLCRDLKVKHVVIEGLRIESNRISEFLKTLGIREIDVESYSLKEVEGLKPVSRVSLSIRERVYRILMQKLSRHGIAFATCKEGLFKLHTAPDCCGAYLLKSYTLRLTLYDIYRYSVDVGKRMQIPMSIDIAREICRRYSRICLDELKVYPKTVSKALRYHEKKLFKVLQNQDLLSHIAPHIVEQLAKS